MIKDNGKNPKVLIDNLCNEKSDLSMRFLIDNPNAKDLKKDIKEITGEYIGKATIKEVMDELQSRIEKLLHKYIEEGKIVENPMYYNFKEE
jgi:hypothetical protein